MVTISDGVTTTSKVVDNGKSLKDSNRCRYKRWADSQQINLYSNQMSLDIFFSFNLVMQKEKCPDFVINTIIKDFSTNPYLPSFQIHILPPSHFHNLQLHQA